MFNKLPDDIIYILSYYINSVDEYKLKLLCKETNENNTITFNLKKKVSTDKLNNFLVIEQYFGRENILYNIKLYPMVNIRPNDCNRIFRTRNNDVHREGYDLIFIEDNGDNPVDLDEGVYSLVKYKNEIIVGYILYEVIVP